MVYRHKLRFGANHRQIFKIVLSKAFDLKCTIPEIENIGEPLLLYQAV
jgi:GTP-binding protein of the ras superfamily involved in termination of M-phase